MNNKSNNINPDPDPKFIYYISRLSNIIYKSRNY